MIARLEPFDQARFLAEFWQRKPCFIPGWLPVRPCPLSTLMTLIDEHELPARLVRGSQAAGDWQLEHGPFQFDDLPHGDSDWTVLVQEIDKVYPPAAELMQAFRFLPDWCLDDVMVSWAADGGSVGPHLDAYDVFLVQTEGRRRWQLAEGQGFEADTRFELALLKDWHAQTELLAKPGDVLYLPAGYAHHGVADGPCQTWSVGIRTPSGPEFLMSLVEQLANSARRWPRLSLGAIKAEHGARISPAQLAELRQLMSDCLAMDDQALEQLAGSFLSSWRLWPANDTAEPEDNDELRQRLAGDSAVRLHPASRLAVTGSGDHTRLFVNGHEIPCSPELTNSLTQARALDERWLGYPVALEALLEAEALELWSD